MSLKEEDRSRRKWPFIRDERGGWVLETLFICILVGILMGTLIPIHQRMSREAKEITLKANLINIRKSIELYHALHERYPDDLRVLVRDKYKMPVQEDMFFSGEYLSAQERDSDGNPLDPFGLQYRYEDEDGSVHSASRGYETW